MKSIKNLILFLLFISFNLAFSMEIDQKEVPLEEFYSELKKLSKQTSQNRQFFLSQQNCTFSIVKISKDKIEKEKSIDSIYYKQIELFIQRWQLDPESKTFDITFDRLLRNTIKQYWEPLFEIPRYCNPTTQVYGYNYFTRTLNLIDSTYAKYFSVKNINSIREFTELNKIKQKFSNMLFQFCLSKLGRSKKAIPEKSWGIFDRCLTKYDANINGEVFMNLRSDDFTPQTICTPMTYLLKYIPKVRTQLIKKMVMANVNLNLRYNENKTPLIYLCLNDELDFENKKELIDLFIKKGADFNWKNSKGESVLQIIYENYSGKDKNQIINLLKEYGAK